jgi:hypothetical protein
MGMEAQHTKHVPYKVGYDFVWCPKLSGPIMAESREEREERHERMVILPEPTSPTRIAL